VFAFVDESSAGGAALFGAEQAVQLAVPLGLAAGLVRSRLARANVADLVRDLERTPSEELEATLARVLNDHSLRLGFRVPERRAYVDAAGRAFELPTDGERRAMTELDQDGEPMAVLVHDPSLRDQEGKLLDAVCAAARLALGNARLRAELRAQLAKVRESRARIVAAADAERLRIERDLHDGAQQRLVALALDLRVAQRKLADAGPEVTGVLESAVESLQGAIEELRELARGVHPAILSEDGLGPALRVEVTDDGVGGADVTKGTGLRGLVDRVEAHGGRLYVESRGGAGTKVIGELPCAS